MEYSVKLARLPAKVIFPERLRGRVGFAPDRGLWYQGFMTKCTYDELSALSDDPEYHRALEALFVLTSQEMSAPPARRKWSAAVLAAVFGALVAAGIWTLWRRPAAEKPSMPEAGVAVSAATR